VHRDRQASRLLAAGDEIGERRCLPAIAARAVSIELIATLEQAGECAEINHMESAAPQRVRVVSLEIRVPAP